MSEPMSSTEIEDVLSSIRRLVSEDMRPLARPAGAAAPQAGEKLILTPALRVVQEDDTEAKAVFVAAPRLHLADPVATAEPEPSALGLVVSSVGAAVDAQPDEWEAEIGDVQPEAAFSSEGWGLPAPDADAELSGDRDNGSDHFEMTDAAEVPSWAQQDGGEVADDEAAPVMQGTIEPDRVWADAAEASVIAELADAPEQDEFLDENLDAGMRFDEDVLRELVRDILREELAGKMGERITRNIRKLVRAEIARSLAAHEFD